MKIIIETPFTVEDLEEERRTAIEDAKRKGLLPTTKEEWERLKREERERLNKER